MDSSHFQSTPVSSIHHPRRGADGPMQLEKAKLRFRRGQNPHQQKQLQPLTTRPLDIFPPLPPAIPHLQLPHQITSKGEFRYLLLCPIGVSPAFFQKPAGRHLAHLGSTFALHGVSGRCVYLSTSSTNTPPQNFSSSTDNPSLRNKY